MELRDHVGVVIGAGSLLGDVLAGALAAEGMTLELVDEPGLGVPDTAARLRDERGAPVVAREVDLAAAEDIADAVDRPVREYGRVDLLVHLASVPRTPTIENGSGDGWDAAVERAFHGVYLVAREAVRAMLPREQGHLVLLCPCPGSPDVFEGALSAAVREGIRAFCRELRHELKHRGIRVDCIQHGPVEPPAAEKAAVVAERLVRPEEVVRAVLWLATSEPDVRVDDLCLAARES